MVLKLCWGFYDVIKISLMVDKVNYMQGACENLLILAHIMRNAGPPQPAAGGIFRYPPVMLCVTPYLGRNFPYNTKPFYRV
jgi:hypothetical protein